MRRAERVVLALAALGETRPPAAGPERADTVAAPGDDLVRIALVADVPDDLVARRVEHIVERGRQFDDTESRYQMPARRPHRRNNCGEPFVGKLAAVFGQLGREAGRG